MAHSLPPRKGSIDRDRVALIRSKITRLRHVAEYLLTHDVFNEAYMREFSEIRREHDQTEYLIDHVHRRGSSAFNTLVDALVYTGQLELAKSLNPDLNIDEYQASARGNRSSSKDGNCVSGEKDRGSSSSPETSEILLDPPSEEAIKQNERFYRLEKEIYAGVPATDGLLKDLKVVPCFELPPYYTDECYPHLSKPKGLAIIFNHRKFNKCKGLLPRNQLTERLGTDVDCRNMERLLKELGYDVRIKNDLTAKEVMEAMARFSFKSEHERCHSAVVVVLTHGTHGELYGSDGELISIQRFVSFLDGGNCPALKNKPKLFILQACRGERFDEGVDALTVSDGHPNGNVARDNVQLGQEQLSRAALLRNLIDLDEADAYSISKTPSDADILIAYATTPGYVSWRNTARGSWFIQAICEVFSRYAYSEEILHLFTRVNDRVSERLSGSGHKQVPEPSSRLRKKFYFLPGL